VAASAACSGSGTRISYALVSSIAAPMSARLHWLTIFVMFASKTEASKLNLLKGRGPSLLASTDPDYIEARGARLHLRHRVKSVATTTRTRRRCPR